MRAVVIIVGALVLLGGVVFIAMGIVPTALMLAVWGVLLLVGTIYERVRYKRLEAAATLGSGWAATEERFIDDETGKPVTVYVDARTGERKYVTHG